MAEDRIYTWLPRSVYGAQGGVLRTRITLAYYASTRQAAALLVLTYLLVYSFGARIRAGIHNGLITIVITLIIDRIHSQVKLGVWVLD